MGLRIRFFFLLLQLYRHGRVFLVIVQVDCHRPYRGTHHLARRFRQRHLAFAAIAASPAFFAEMVIARVLGAPRADAHRFFRADVAGEWH
jgi:hypothetical protein